MKHTLLFFSVLFSAHLSFGQLADNFSDGNFNLNPTWQGDSLSFKINSQNQLQLNSSTAGTSMLATGINLNVNDTIEWDFYIEQSFAPSSQNYSRVYLSSDQAILNSAMNGFYLQFGESGTNDAISLYKQTANTSTLLGKGVSGRIASAFGVSVKVVYYPNGFFEIYTDYTGGNNYQFEFSTTSNLNFSQGFFGWNCVYTISNASAFYLDNIYVGPLIKDTLSPQISSAAFINDSLFKIVFDESITGFSLSHVQLNSNSIDTFYANSDSSQFEFLLHQKLNSGDTIQVKLLNISDLYFNNSDTLSTELIFIKCEYANPGDLIINEIMCNPSGANNLPNAEYLELFNNSNKFITTNNLFISDASTTGELGVDTIAPHQYKVYSSTASKSLLQSFGINAIGISNFPTLNNDGDDITLKDSLKIIDEVKYNSTFYNDDYKNQGGWSIEKIQPDYLCYNTKNWKASCDLRGGSPGEINCNDTILIDDEHPELTSIYVLDSNHVIVNFSEEVNTSTFNVNNFIIDETVFPDNVFIEKLFSNHVILKVNLNFIPDEKHTLKIINPIFDCSGNTLLNNFNYDFGVGVSPEKGDLIFNEIMFNPIVSCSDFIELYNKSDKIISLKNLCCSRRNATTNQVEYNSKITTNDLTVMPHAYCVLTNEESETKKCYPNIKQKFVINYAIPAMNDDEGKIVLLDANAVILDELSYSAKQHSPLLVDVEGVSLERVSFSASTNNLDNWKSASYSCGYSTPTQKNSQAIDVEQQSNVIAINPSVISPDADGFDDNMQIEINNTNAGMWGSLQILNCHGQLIRTLINSDLIGTNDKVIWDGTDDNNKIMSPGIYIMVATLITENGEVKNSRMPLVIAEGKR
jgi:hypothetical protein